MPMQMLELRRVTSLQIGSISHYRCVSVADEVCTRTGPWQSQCLRRSGQQRLESLSALLKSLGCTLTRQEPQMSAPYSDRLAAEILNMGTQTSYVSKTINWKKLASKISESESPNTPMCEAYPSPHLNNRDPFYP